MPHGGLHCTAMRLVKAMNNLSRWSGCRANSHESCLGKGFNGTLMLRFDDYGLLRGACHRARIRATRWLAMTISKALAF